MRHLKTLSIMLTSFIAVASVQAMGDDLDSPSLHRSPGSSRDHDADLASRHHSPGSSRDHDADLASRHHSPGSSRDHTVVSDVSDSEATNSQ